MMRASVVGRVSDHVWLIDTGGLGFRESVAAYLVKGSRGFALVDSGYPADSGGVARVLSSLGFSRGVFFPTHVHLDHGGGVGGLVGLFKESRVVAHERAAKHIINPGRLVSSASVVYGDSGVAKIGHPKPVEGERVDSFSREVEVDLGGVVVRGFYTPGHAPHHASVLVEPDRVVITGDAISARFPELNMTPLPVTPPPSFKPGEYFNSLRVIESLRPKSLLAPHFGVVEVREGFFDDEEKTVREWVRSIETLRNRGVGARGIARDLSSRLAAEAGVESLPVYAENTLRISVMGVLHLLGEDLQVIARELRPSY